MTATSLTDWLPTEPEPEVRPSAMALLTDVRAAATSTSDVAAWARANSAPEDWSGDAAVAAAHAVTRFADRSDTVSTALQRGAFAIDTFLDAMARRCTEHAALMDRRTSLNNDRAALLERTAAAGDDGASGLETQASTLAARIEAYVSDLEAWRVRVLVNEDACIADLRAIDTRSEAEVVAALPRIDTEVLATQLECLGPDTSAVNDWWTDLTQAQRNALIISDPDLVGNTDGIPTSDRDEANRASVQRDLERLLAQQEALLASGNELSAGDLRRLENAQAIEEAIANAARLPYAGLEVDVNVLAYAPEMFDGDGVAVIAYGDPDTAEHTAIYVPGIMQDGTRIDDNGMDALALHNEAVTQGTSLATIAWIGYDSPNWNPDGSVWGYPASAGDASHVLSEANAEQGGLLLSHFVDGLNTTHGVGSTSHLTVIGHSYGSTTSAHGAADGMDADSLVLIGSPGAGGEASHVSDLHMPPGQVFAGSADNDPVTWLGGGEGVLPGRWDDGLGLGEDPAQHDFGARVFEVDPGARFEGLDGLVEVGLNRNHGSYFDEDNPALATMAEIVSGRGDEVIDTGGRHRDAHDLLYAWTGQEAARQGEQVHDEITEPFGEWFTQLWKELA